MGTVEVKMDISIVLDLPTEVVTPITRALYADLLQPVAENVCREWLKAYVWGLMDPDFDPGSPEEGDDEQHLLLHAARLAAASEQKKARKAAERLFGPKGPIGGL